jgi:hypothetical protein
MTRPTVPPIAIAAPSPTARVSVATAMITSIRKKVRIVSQRNACPSEPEGSVAPTSATFPSEARRRSAAAIAAAALGSPIGDDTRPREVSCQPEREADGEVEVGAGDVADGVDHRHDHESERQGDADVPEGAGFRRP